MTKRLFSYPVLLLLISISFLSCSKSDSNLPVTPSFTWTYGGIDYTATLTEAYTNGNGPYVIAAVIGTNFFTFTKRVDFILTSFAIGTYQFQSGTTNLVRCMDNPYITAGSVNTTVTITANSNNLLSGNFSGLLNDNSPVNKPISGTFINVPIVN